APGPVNVLSAVVTVTATGFETAALRMRTPGEPDMVSPPYAFDGRESRPAALGLLPETTYEIDVLVTADGETQLGEMHSFTTDALPAWVPTITPVGSPSVEGYVVLSHPPGAIIIDNQGRVRWYVGDPDGPIFGFLTSFMAHPNGEYTLNGLNDQLRVHRAINELGEEVRLLACVGRETRFHEIRVLADGGYWVGCENPVPTDLSSRGGNADGEVIWTVFQHVGPDGSLEFEFNTADHFSLDDIDQDVFVGVSQVNITHGNAIDFDTDGNLLFSWRSLNEVTKVDAVTGEVIWRLGGNASTLTVVDDTRAFERPHGLRAVGPGLVQLLDNGSVAPSRLVRYAVDEQAMTATRVLEFVTEEGSYTSTGGSTEVVGTDHALVSFGTVGKVVEVNAAGVETFDLTGVEGTYIFRASRISSLYAAERAGD
ncbi:MAG: arylsulfotransferase family protein, partial [Gemmatimonadota bacterium]|nr:arylsulfotransferase family protein [Gemmatimonadota bacterium]